MHVPLKDRLRSRSPRRAPHANPYRHEMAPRDDDTHHGHRQYQGPTPAPGCSIAAANVLVNVADPASNIDIPADVEFTPSTPLSPPILDNDMHAKVVDETIHLDDNESNYELDAGILGPVEHYDELEVDQDIAAAIETMSATLLCEGLSGSTDV